MPVRADRPPAILTFGLGRVVVDKELIMASSPECEECCVTLERGVGECENHLHYYFNFVCKYKFEVLIDYYTKMFGFTCKY